MNLDVDIFEAGLESFIDWKKVLLYDGFLSFVFIYYFIAFS
jgi:hypothetical protein